MIQSRHSARKNYLMSGNLKRTLKKDATAWIFLIPSLICFIIFVWQPFVQGGIMSFFKTKGFSIVDFAGLEYYKDVLSDSSFKNAFFNSCKYTLWALVIGAPLPIIAAILLNEMVHIKGFFRFSVYFPSMIPGIVAAIMWKILFEPSTTGFLNSIFSTVGLPTSEWLQNSKITILLITIVSTWSGFGPTTILYLADLQSIDVALYEAASIDGAGFFRKIRNITLPHMSGMIKMMIIMQIIGVFQSFERPLAMTGGGPNEASLTLMMLAYNYMFAQGAVDKSIALSVMVCIVLIIFSILYFRVTKKRNAA